MAVSDKSVIFKCVFKNHKAMTLIYHSIIKEIIFGFFFPPLVKSEQNGFTLAQVTLPYIIKMNIFFI